MIPVIEATELLLVCRSSGIVYRETVPRRSEGHVSFNGSSSAALGNTIYGIANIVIETASRTVAQNVNVIREALPKP